MKIGNKRISISFIEILGLIVATIGIVLFFILEDSLLSILSICVSAMCVLGLFIKLNTKMNSIVTNQYNFTYSVGTSIHTSSQASSYNTESVDGNYEEIQINNKGFVVVNRAENTSKAKSVAQPAPMRAYDVEKSGDYKATTHSYTILPVEEQVENSTKAAQEETDMEKDLVENNAAPKPPMANEELSIETPIPIETEENDIQVLNNELTDKIELSPETETNLSPDSQADDSTLQESRHNTMAEEKIEISFTTAQEDDLEEQIKVATEQNIDEINQQQVELHISDMLESTQHASLSSVELNKIIAQLLVRMAQNIRYTTAGLVWVNYEKQCLILDNYVCDSDIKDFIIDRFRIDDNVFTEIINTAKPLFLTEKYHSDVEQQYFQYHSQPIGIKSFIGIPIIHNNTIVSILFVDSNQHKYSEHNEYNFMKSIDKIFSHLISFYENSIKNENAANVLEVMNSFSTMITERGSNFNDVCLAITDFVQEHYACTSIGIVTYNLHKEKWTINSYISTERVQKQFLYEPIDIKDALVGASITRFHPILLSTVPTGFVRVNQYEADLSNGSFISVPIKSITDCYGALFIESRDNNLVKNVNVKILEAICNQAGEIFERLKWVRLFDDYVSTEIGTGILTQNAFNRNINAEIARAAESNNSLIIILVALDKYSYFDDAYKKSQIFQYVIELLKAQLRSFEVIGRVREDVVGMLLFNRNIHHVQLMMESINKKLATQYIEIQKEKLIATISVGINEFTSKDDWTSFTTNATAVLNLAQKDRNTVKIFQ